MSEPRKLSLGCEALVALLVAVTVGLAVGAVVAVRAKWIEDEKRRETCHTLAECADHRRSRRVRGNAVAVSPVEFTYAESDGIRFYSATPRDAWGNPIRYVCPGPIHKNGFDLISAGPDGIFENGQGDDIVVGEDLPGGLAAISSGSGSGAGR
jgi:hypothetical protein